jgi:hypothetical protein
LRYRLFTTAIRGFAIRVFFSSQMTGHLKAFVWLVLLSPFAAHSQVTQASAPTATQTDDQTTGIPRFFAHSRQVIVAAQVWDRVDPKKPADTSWISEGAMVGQPDGGAALRKIYGLLSPTRSLTAESFHVFDNGVEQKINYFKGTSFSVYPGPWIFQPTVRGLWGSLYGPESPSVSYLIGYVPPTPEPGECRTIKIVVPNHYVHVNREKYCAIDNTEERQDNEETKVELQLRKFANSTAPGTMNVSVAASVFWSSSVLSLIQQPLPSGNAVDLPSTDYRFVVEVHDSKAPATVQIATGFGSPYQIWRTPCSRNAAIHILGMVYKADGALQGEFRDTYRCEMSLAATPDPIKKSTAAYSIPTLFDTQMELQPGIYNVQVVVTDGKNFGRALVPLRVARSESGSLTVSDVMANSFLRDASWIIRDAAEVTPGPLMPTPLVSKDVQFLPLSNADLHKGNALSLYFEIYRPQPDTADTAIYYRIRITDLKTGTNVMNTEPISAPDFVVPGNSVVPIGLKIDTDKLPPGSYRLEVKASDSTGQESRWRAVDFNIQ